MNIYDEILNKYASSVGYVEELKNDSKFLYKKTQLLSKICIFAESLHRIKRKQGIYYIVGYDLGNSYELKEHINDDPKNNLNVWQFCFIKTSKTPNICFMINSLNDTYEEVNLDDIIEVTDNENM